MSKTTQPREAQAKAYNPRSDTDPSKPRFPVRLTDEQYERVSRASFEMRISMSKLASDALDMMLDGSERSNRYMQRKGYGRDSVDRPGDGAHRDGDAPKHRGGGRAGGGDGGDDRTPPAKPRRRSAGKPRTQQRDA